MKKRGELFKIEVINKYAPIYVPNYNFCRKRKDPLIIPFNKMSGRNEKRVRKRINPINFLPKDQDSKSGRNKDNKSNRNENDKNKSSRGYVRKQSGNKMYFFYFINFRFRNTIDFSKNLPRDRLFGDKKTNEYPCFMQKGSATNRFAINQMTEKGLELNNYTTRDFSKAPSTLRVFKKPERNAKNSYGEDSRSFSSIFSDD